MKKSENSSCYEWQGGLGTEGYGTFRIGRGMYKAHRVLFTILKQQVPLDKVINHLCSNRSCCNIFHLEICSSHRNTIYARDYENGIARQILSLDDVHTIKNLVSSGKTRKEVAQLYNVGYECIKDIMNGTNWSNVLPELHGCNLENRKRDSGSVTIRNGRFRARLSTKLGRKTIGYYDTYQQAEVELSKYCSGD